MIVLLFFILAWYTVNAIKQSKRAKKQQQSPQTTERIQRNLAALEALQAQRNCIKNQLTLIDGRLENIRREHDSIRLAALAARNTADRDKARKRMMALEAKVQQIEANRARCFGQLAQVEVKISLLIS